MHDPKPREGIRRFYAASQILDKYPSLESIPEGMHIKTTRQARSAPCPSSGKYLAPLVTGEMRMDTVQREGSTEETTRSSRSGTSSTRYTTNTTQLTHRHPTPYTWPLERDRSSRGENRSSAWNSDLSPIVKRKPSNSGN